MNNLTPEQRPDRNGNIVTRWVRRSVEKVNKALEIPPVVADKDVTLEMEVRRTIEAQIEQHKKAQKTLEDAFIELEITHDAVRCRNAYLGLSYGDDAPAISSEGMKAFHSFRDVVASEGLLKGVKIASEMQKMAGHVMVNPDDSTMVENMLRRGIKDSDTALGVLKEIRESETTSSLNDGFL